MLLQLGDYLLLVGLVTELNDVRNDVVTVLVFCEVETALKALLEQGLKLILSALLDNALHDPAPEAMHRHLVDLIPEEVEHELNLVGLQLLDNLLNNMVTVLVLDALYHILPKFQDDLFLLVVSQLLQGLLDHPTSVLIHAEFQNVAFYHIKEHLPLLQRAEIEHFLYDIVSEFVLDQL